MAARPGFCLRSFARKEKKMNSRPNHNSSMQELNAINEGVDEIDFVQILKEILRNFWLIFILTCCGICAGAFYSLSLTPQYRAETKIYIEGVSAADAAMGGVDIFDVAMPDDKTLKSEIEVIKSNLIIEKVVEDLELHKIAEFNSSLRENGFIDEFLVKVKSWINSIVNKEINYIDEEKKSQQEKLSVFEAVRENLGIKIIPDTFIVSVGFEASSPDLAAEIASKFGDAYILDRIENKASTTNESLEYLTNRLPELRLEADRLEQERADFETESGIMSTETLMLANSQLAQRTEQIAKLEKRNETIIEVLDEFKNGAVTKEDARIILERLSPEKLRNFDQSKIISVANSEMNMAADWSEMSYSNELSRVRSTTARLRQRILTQSIRQSSFLRLEQEAAVANELYQSFLVRVKELSQKAAIPERDVRVIQEAQPPAEPFEPRRYLIVAFFGILTAVLATAFALLKERFFAPFRDKNELQKSAGVSIFASTPVIKRNLSLKQLASFDLSKAQRGLVSSIQDLQSLLLQIQESDGAEPKLISLTSSVPGEGKTTTSILLAQSFARSGKRTLLVDCDLHRFKLSKEFESYTDIKYNIGMAQILDRKVSLENNDCINGEVINKVSGFNGVDFLFSGEKSNTAASSFSSHSFENCLNILSKHYDVVIIDCPPVIANTDSISIGNRCELTLYLVRPGVGRRSVVTENVRKFQRHHKGRHEFLFVGEKRSISNGYGYDYGYSDA